MCGIVGYIGKCNAKGILINGLKKLEYRGYDSAGVAVISKNKLVLRKCKGKIASLESRIITEYIPGPVGIGHTRWATHGKPSDENAHPHTDCKERLVVVHNGIIENYVELKKQLTDEGHIFKSETDTEIVAHLVEKFMGKYNLLHSVYHATKLLRGSYALAVISIDEPNKLVAARYFSPLVLGIGQDEYFVASDIPAILDRTRQVLPMDDGEIAELTDDGVTIFDHALKKIKKKPTMITWDPVTAEKGGYKHFMLKEIHEQPQTIEETFRGRLNSSTGEVYLEESNLNANLINSVKKIYFVACGTAYHAGMIGKYLIEDIAKIPCEVDLASEFRYRKPLLNKESMVIAITQSGETADTLAAIREAKKHKAHTLAICNVIGSSATREADGVIFTRTGPEISVASTKAFTAQVTVLYMLMIFLGRVKKTLGKTEATKLIHDLFHLPALINKVLAMENKIQESAHKHFKESNFLYLGRNVNYPIALEGALKLKEISYIHAEGYAAGEMKHGPIALIDEQMSVIVLATESAVYEKILSNIQEIKARGGRVIALATVNDTHIKKMGADEIFFMPKTSEILSAILNTVVLQLFSYHVATLRGCDVDQPRNLAKSVVVE